MARKSISDRIHPVNTVLTESGFTDASWPDQLSDETCIGTTSGYQETNTPKRRGRKSTPKGEAPVFTKQNALIKRLLG